MNKVLLTILVGILFVGAVTALGYKIGILALSHKTTPSSPSSDVVTPTVPLLNRSYYLALSASQAAKLKDIIASNQEAKDAFGDIKANAQDALNDTPNPIDKIQSSKILKGDDRKTRSLESVKDADKVYALGFTYAVTGDTKFAKKAQDFVLAWARQNMASADPIDQRLLEPMFMGYDLIKPTMSAKDQQTVDAWMISGAHTLIDAINTGAKATSDKNNHQSHLLAVVAMVGFSTNNQELIDYVIDGYKKQIKVDLNADGSSYDFHQRDALYYHVFTLEPLLTVARVSQMNGIDLFDYTTSPVASKAANLQKSIDFLLPYAKGTKTHAEWVHSTAPFDKTRALAGQEEFQPGVLFQPKQAYPTLELYYYFNPQILPLAIKTSNLSTIKKYPDFLMVYLDAVR